jgi:uncharacterized protein GlcG (DUF336 family)
MTLLSLELAEQMAKATLQAARARKLPPMCVAVVDAGGHVKFAAREDGGSLGGIDIAAGKARTAAMFGSSSRQIAGALAANPQATQSVLAMFPGRIMLLAGAVLVRDAHGVTLGAIAAAGGAPDDDEAIAALGAALAAGPATAG